MCGYMSVPHSSQLECSPADVDSNERRPNLRPVFSKPVSLLVVYENVSYFMNTLTIW